MGKTEDSTVVTLQKRLAMNIPGKLQFARPNPKAARQYAPDGGMCHDKATPVFVEMKAVRTHLLVGIQNGETGL
ncbi:MAG: hypothetical protein PHQ05_11180 [Sterolibacterium sp.]|nr:hypothetical protein [Sterolibacterium sp.]